MARAEAELAAAAGDDEEAAPLVSAGAARRAASGGPGAPRDVHLLSAAFLFVFLAYHAAQNLQSTVNTVRPRSLPSLSTSSVGKFRGKSCLRLCRDARLLPRFASQDENLGSLSLALLFTAFAAVGSAVVRRMGSRRALVVGTSGYLLFIAANLAPTWYANARPPHPSVQFSGSADRGSLRIGESGDPCVASEQQNSDKIGVEAEYSDQVFGNHSNRANSRGLL
ncbi:hypothetical protein PR202_gb23979 [Eleusine coracana subsp. coracana]|uniref:Uncharacterized protein n=1 Tax=Eleusine coracana subsp. coracana TaxID=191504 RepID=A0AAV5FHK8_ELECO|nr:hypothetical protein PR202_gb23979 [Eleusine coracana subsp. coracana]